MLYGIALEELKFSLPFGDVFAGFRRSDYGEMLWKSVGHHGWSFLRVLN